MEIKKWKILKGNNLEIQKYTDAGKTITNDHKNELVQLDAMRTEWMSFMERDDNRYHVTFTFRTGISDLVAIAVMEKIIIHLSQRCYGNSNKKVLNDNGEYFRKRYLSGLLIAEYQNSETIHFHAIFNEEKGKLPEYEKFTECVKGAINSLPKNYQKVCYDRMAFVQEYTAEPNDYNGIPCSTLEKYLTKSHETLDMYRKLDSKEGVYLLHSEGLLRPW